jgi:hypothetical protein
VEYCRKSVLVFDSEIAVLARDGRVTKALLPAAVVNGLLYFIINGRSTVQVFYVSFLY